MAGDFLSILAMSSEVERCPSPHKPARGRPATQYFGNTVLVMGPITGFD